MQTYFALLTFMIILYYFITCLMKLFKKKDGTHRLLKHWLERSQAKLFVVKLIIVVYNTFRRPVSSINWNSNGSRCLLEAALCWPTFQQEYLAGSWWPICSTTKHGILCGKLMNMLIMLWTQILLSSQFIYSCSQIPHSDIFKWNGPMKLFAKFTLSLIKRIRAQNAVCFTLLHRDYCTNIQFICQFRNGMCAKKGTLVVHLCLEPQGLISLESFS